MNDFTFRFRDNSGYTYYREGLGELLREWLPEEHTLVEIAVNEAINNAIIHGCKSAADPQVVVRMQRHPDGGIVVRIKDSGSGFQPCPDADAAAVAAATASASEANSGPDLKESGRGLLIMRHVFDEIRFNESGNEVILAKKASTPEEDADG